MFTEHDVSTQTSPDQQKPKGASCLDQGLSAECGLGRKDLVRKSYRTEFGDLEITNESPMDP